MDAGYVWIYPFNKYPLSIYHLPAQMLGTQQRLKETQPLHSGGSKQTINIKSRMYGPLYDDEIQIGTF